MVPTDLFKPISPLCLPSYPWPFSSTGHSFPLVLKPLWVKVLQAKPRSQTASSLPARSVLSVALTVAQRVQATLLGPSTVWLTSQGPGTVCWLQNLLSLLW